MKFSLLKNDKSTAKDELYLSLLILVCLAAGTVLVVTSPAFWIIDSVTTKVFGALWILIGVMFIPGLIYRLFTNDTKK